VKNVGVVKLNLGETIDVAGEIKKKLQIDKLSEKYNASIEFKMKSTLVASA
jgi:hypothetical protein